MVLKNKRGERILSQYAVFILVNLMFFMLFGGFIIVSASGAIVLEQSYAKEIALFVDSGKPGMSTKLDIKDGLAVFGNKVLGKSMLESLLKRGADLDEIVKDERVENIVVFNENKYEVLVSLAGRRGYAQSYFSDYCVKDSIDAEGFLTLEILETEECSDA